MEYCNLRILTIWKFCLKRTERYQWNDWLKLPTSVVNQHFRIRTKIVVVLWMYLYYLLRMNPFPFQNPGTPNILQQLFFHTVAVLWNKWKMSLATEKYRILYVRIFLVHEIWQFFASLPVICRYCRRSCGRLSSAAISKYLQFWNYMSEGCFLSSLICVIHSEDLACV